jgi:signal peptidase I
MNPNRTYERKPLIALTASLVMPGLGQIYNGELTKGLSTFLIFSFAIPLFSWLSLHGPESLIWLVVFLGVLIALGIYIFSIRDAFLSSKRIGTNYVPGAYNQPYTYLAILFFGYFFVLNQLTQYTRTWCLEAYKVPSTSMIPNLLRGDHFFVDKRINFPGAKGSVHRGDASIFVYPNDRTTVYIKRVIGLPGDKVEINDMEVIVNGKSTRLEEVKELSNQALNPLLADHVAYRESSDQGDSYIALWKKDAKREPLSLTVPNGHVFVLGDNRDGSYDSRTFGTIPLTDVIAKAKQIWFSIDSETGVRWSRFGKLLDVNSRI